MRHGQAWAATAILAALTTACFGATASGPDAVDTDAATRHASHDASPRDAHEAGRGHGDATRTADARAADVAVDAITRDAPVRDAPPAMDAAAHDATPHVDAVAETGPRDAGRDSTAADAAGTDAAPVCAYPDASTGTMDILAAVPGVTIQDFDIDSANVFFTTATGGILSCPATDCTGTPTTVWPSDPDGGLPQLPSFLVRIGLGGLVFAENVPCGPGECGNMRLVLMGRDGSNAQLLPQHSPFGELIVDSGLTGDFVNGYQILDAGGASGLFVCPSGATCPSATKVEGVDAKSIKALYADPTTLYFTDTDNALFSCDGAAALAGSCTPKLLACPVPPFTELRGDASYVYLLKSDGSAIVRIAR